MSYQTALDRMYALGHELANTPSHKFDLEHMRRLLGSLDHPEGRFPSVLIAGTNGKGSTAATLASILRASGLNTALYTSPHLVRINERIRVNQEEIGDDDFARLHDEVDRAADRLVASGELPWHPSFFEMLTAIAFLYFARAKVDIAVLEVGMGGRLDATNVVDPSLSVITDIALDHEKYLGYTVEEIAREKAGIIRPGGVVVLLPQQPQASDVIGSRVVELGARAVSAVPYMPPVGPRSPAYFSQPSGSLSSVPEGDGGEAGEEGSERSSAGATSRYRLQFMETEIAVETPLVGRHQYRNIALALAAARELADRGFRITPDSVERGLRATRWPGRFQVLPARGLEPEYVLDVAHNPSGAWALRSTLSACYEGRRLLLIFGALRDKAIGQMGDILFPLAERVLVTAVDNPRAATQDEIRRSVRVSVDMEDVPNVASALARAREQGAGERVVVITGSIYLVGEAMRWLRVRI
jgi:dihydrofolate synthase/folylpolyglutamate synthase